MGIKVNGGAYFKSYMEPMPLLLPLNIIGEIATPISLSLRLFGNILGGTIIMGLINSALQNIGGEIIEKIKPIKIKDKKQNKISENSKNDVINTEDDFDGYTQTNMFSDKKIAPEEQGLSQQIIRIKDNIDYNIIEEMRQDGKNEHFVNMFDSIYRIIVDVMTTDSKYIRINKQNKPISIVRLSLIHI